MNEVTVTVTERAGPNAGRECKATLLLCPECGEARFVVYFPEGMDHCHFQCCACDTSFCDGCQDGH